MFKKIDVKQPKIKVFCYGNSGAGKTRLIKTLPGKVGIMSVEAGLLSLRNEDGSYNENMSVIDINEPMPDGKLPTSEIKLNRIRKLYSYLTQDEAKKSFDWIAIDAMSEIGAIVQQEGKRLFPDNKNTFASWNFYYETMVELIKVFRDLDYNVYMTCLSETSKDENGCRYEDALLSTKLQPLIPSLFDEVFYLDMIPNEKGEAKRKLICQATSKTKTKDRSGRLDCFEEPDMTKIVTKIIGETKKEGETK